MPTATLPITPDPSPGPAHVAIIMDGNGRWARARGLPRVAGHRRGADAVRRVVRGAGELGIPILTLFAFSTENWARPADEVADLMGLLRHYLRSELRYVHPDGFHFGPNVEWVPSAYYVDNANTLKTDPYALLGFRAGYTVTKGLTVFFDGRNLTDERYISTVSVVPVATPSASSVLSTASLGTGG